jgi:N-acetylmuramic acid 6-phosphate etherase
MVLSTPRNKPNELARIERHGSRVIKMTLEDHLLTESRNPRSASIDTLSALELVGLINTEDAMVVAAVGAEAESIARAIEWAAERLERGGRLIYVGAGTSGRLGVLDAAECPPTFNTPPGMVVGLIAGGTAALTRAVEGAEDDPQRGASDIGTLEVGTDDLVIGIAASGRTPYVLGAVREARRRGAHTVGLACTRPSLLGAEVDLAISPLVGAEVVAGSTRLKAGTATKMILNMISTGAMVRIGKTLGNRMVDLRPSNEKLRIRSRRIVRELAGLDDDQAAQILSRCEGHLKRALVVALAGVDPAMAQALLDTHGGQVRAAIRAAGGREPL